MARSLATSMTMSTAIAVAADDSRNWAGISGECQYGMARGSASTWPA